MSSYWESTGRRLVATDIISNGKELLAGSSIFIDWGLVLSNIRTLQVGSVQYGAAAIAMRDAHLIGALASGANWSMNDPAIVYLSGKCLANSVDSKLEDFKMRMREAAVTYGKKALRYPDLYMKILDFLLELGDRNKNKHIIKQVMSLLREGDIKEAYKIVDSRGDLVRRRR